MVKLISGILIGAATGFLFYRFIGCSSGVCPIISNPYISIVYGGLAGAVLSGVIVDLVARK